MNMTNTGPSSQPLVGIDMGGTKIEIAALGYNGDFLVRTRQPTPDSYSGTIELIGNLLSEVEAKVGPVDRFGVSTCGSLSRRTGLMHNANATFLNGQPFERDLARLLNRQVNLSNDANCLAASEAFDGNAAGAAVVFAVVLGTGCGGGIAIDGRIIDGANGIAGEWGHNPLPGAGAPTVGETKCWCGHANCLETWISGTGLARMYQEKSGQNARADGIVRLMRAGDPAASRVFEEWTDHLARSLATIANMLDPDVFVFGGGLAYIPEIYSKVPQIMKSYVIDESWFSRFKPAKWGDSSGVRGAARLSAHIGSK
jgi:fructokinase